MVQVEATIRGLTNLQAQAATLSGSASVLADNQPVVTAALTQLGLSSGAADTVAGALAGDHVAIPFDGDTMHHLSDRNLVVADLRKRSDRRLMGNAAT